MHRHCSATRAIETCYYTIDWNILSFGTNTFRSSVEGRVADAESSLFMSAKSVIEIPQVYGESTVTASIGCASGKNNHIDTELAIGTRARCVFANPCQEQIGRIGESLTRSQRRTLSVDRLRVGAARIHMEECRNRFGAQ